MDSTPNPNQNQNHHPIPIKIAARKLPIKRKSPDPYPNLNLVPKTETTNYVVEEEEEEEDEIEDVDDLKPPPPFKFHRIWTEPDEIRFLEGLLLSSDASLIFPRDLHIFYQRFTQSTPQPYTKSQLSEKLRRLRKKFRVISSRIASGLDASLLTPHDQALFHLSKQLWHPDYTSSSPFYNNNKSSSSSRVKVRVSFNPTFALPPPPSVPCEIHNIGHNSDDDNGDELNLPIGNHIGRIAAKAVVDVFETSLQEVRSALVQSATLSSTPTGSSPQQGKTADLMMRCREQCLSEFDVLARRLRLVLEKSIHHH